MSLIAEVKNGSVVNANTTSKAKEASNGADEETFLALLVAEMQNQDPLEPSESTDWIAQYAQFTQVETINNMSDSLDMMRANSLVGKEVYIKTEDEGDTGFIKGKVDYVVYQGGTVKLSINESLYDLKDLDTVVDNDYDEAFTLAESFSKAVKKLPKPEQITTADLDKIEELTKAYAGMTDYQKGFISDDDKDTLAKAIMKAAELSDKASDSSEPEVKEL